MAYAEKRGSGKNPWRARYRQPDGTIGSEPGFRTKSSAENWGEEQEAAMRHGTWIDPAKAKVLFGAWVKIWQKANAPRPGTASKRRQLLKSLLLPEWEFTPLHQVNNVFTVKAWATRAVQGHDAVTIGHARSLLSSILTGAEDAGYIVANKLYGRKISVENHERDGDDADKEEVWAQPDDAYRMYERLGGVHGLMVLAECYLGPRWGELNGLHKDNCLLKRTDRIDGKPVVRHVIRIDGKVGSLHEDLFELDEAELASWQAKEDARLARCREKEWKANRRKAPESEVRLYLGPPKNKYSAREVDVPPFLVKLLGEHIESWPHDYPFVTPSGAWWRRRNFSRVLRPAADGRDAVEKQRGRAERAEWDPILPGFTMRGGRHTHDTWMKDDRVDRALRFLTMGWVPKDIEGTYEHVTPEMRQHRLTTLEARWTRGMSVALRDAG